MIAQFYLSVTISILYYFFRTYSPGLGETEQFPNLSESVGVELEVVLLISETLMISGLGRT